MQGIKLGEVVAAAPVKLPKVRGWSHQSGVALLHDWTSFKTPGGFIALRGTVYNCPGAFDGGRFGRVGDVFGTGAGAAERRRPPEAAEYQLSAFSQSSCT